MTHTRVRTLTDKAPDRKMTLLKSANDRSGRLSANAKAKPTAVIAGTAMTTNSVVCHNDDQNKRSFRRAS
jgi:hypothetical protein